jgi:hypothetical protein
MERDILKTKTVKIALEGFGSYLGIEKGCFVVKDRNGEIERYPLFENQISEVQIKSGNCFFRCFGFSGFLGNRPADFDTEGQSCGDVKKLRR